MPSRDSERHEAEPSAASSPDVRGEPLQRPRVHERELLHVCGLAAVTALFAADPGRVERLFFETRLSDALVPARRQLARLHKPYRQITAPELARVAGTVHHGGVVAVAQPQKRPRLTAEALTGFAADARLVLLLDGIGNPHNLGAIARTAAYFGVERLILSDRPEQALPSDASYRVAEGGLDRMILHRARLPDDLALLRRHYRIVGTAPEGGTALAEIARDRPIVMVLGNEEAGLSPEMLAACDTIATIPGGGSGQPGVQSLNVAAAAAVLIYALSAG